MPTATRTVVVTAITGIIILALGIRTGVAAIAPLATRIDLDVALEGLPLGALGTIPPIAYAVAAGFSPWFARKVGLEKAAIVVGLIGVATHVWRGIAPGYVSLFVATAVLMLAVGVGNVILPGLVKLYAPDRIAGVTAAYGTAMAISSSVPTVLGVWMADQFGWRVSLAAWAFVSLIGVLPWLLLLPHAKARGVAQVELEMAMPVIRKKVSLTRSPTALAIMVIFGVSGISAYSWFAMLPLILIDTAGYSESSAALALGIFTITGLPMSLVIPPLAARRGWSSVLVGFAVFSGLVGMLGLMFLPAMATTAWVIFLAMGPLTFPLSLTLIGKRTANHVSALLLSGFVNKWGYVMAAAGPLAVGFALEVTGGWGLSLGILMAVSLLEIPAIWILAKERIVDDEIEDVAQSAHMSK